MPYPQGWAPSSSALCRADTWHHVRCSLGSSLSWVMRLGLLEAFNYQPNVQTHFSPEMFMQAQLLFTRKGKRLSPPGRQDVTPGWDFTPVKSILLQPWYTHIPAPLPNNPFSRVSDPVCWVTLPLIPPDSVCIMDRRTVFTLLIKLLSSSWKQLWKLGHMVLSHVTQAPRRGFPGEPFLLPSLWDHDVCSRHH